MQCASEPAECPTYLGLGTGQVAAEEGVYDLWEIVPMQRTDERKDAHRG